MSRKIVFPGKGFTIVELLIVIVVIGILAALVISTFAGAQARARDVQRKTDIKAIAKALEVHHVNKGSYTLPENICTDTSYGAFDTCGGVAGATGDWDVNSDLRDLVTDKSFSALPKDPINNTSFYYSYEPHSIAANGIDGYDLCARMETEGNYCVVKRQ